MLKSAKTDRHNLRTRTTSPGEGVLPSKRLLAVCRWMGSHFHNWTDYNGVTFLVELLEWGRKFSGFWDKKILVSRDLKIERFTAEKWFLLLFKYLTFSSH